MHYTQRLLLSILLCLFLVQCSNSSTSEKAEHIQELDNLTVYPADSEPTYEVTLVQEQSFGGGEDPGEPYLGVITGCVVDDNDRIIIKGINIGSTYKLLSFNSDGTFHTQIGRPGKGPGEFENVSNLQIKSGRIFLYDLSTERLSVFNTDDYSFEGTTVPKEWSVMDHEAVRRVEFSDFRARADGNFLSVFKPLPDASGRPADMKIFLIDQKGNALEPDPQITLPSPYYITGDNPDNSMIPMSSSFRIPLPFLGTSRFALTNDDELYTARTDKFLIKKYDSEGTYQSAFYYPVTGPPFDMESFIDREAGPSQQAFKNALKEVDIEIPESFSVIRDLIVDDENRIWVTVAVEYRGKSELWMLGESGELLAKVTPPGGQWICDIHNGYLYTYYRDKQGDGPESWESKVVKYRINLTER